MFWTAKGARLVGFSGSPQRQQRYLRRHADAHGKAESSEAAIDVECGFLCAVARGRSGSVAVVRHRQPIQASHERSDEPRRSDAVIHDFELYLAAVSVAGETEFDAQVGGAAE